MNYFRAGAAFSKCGHYRYSVWRSWEPGSGSVLFIGLNPSTADASKDDPTLTRCVHFAQSWGFGSVSIVNLFAYRTTYPNVLLQVKKPVGPKNDLWIRKLVTQSDIVIAAWGNAGSINDRSKVVLDLIPVPHCLKVNRTGAPSHPLYLPKTCRPIRFPLTKASLHTH